MKAMLCTAYGPPESLVLTEVPSPTPSAGQVVIRIKASSVNFPDSLIIQGKYQFQPPLPFAPGSDVAGVVSAVGDGVPTVHVGDRVMAFIPYGGYAEEVACPATSLLHLPDAVDFVTAAAFQMTYATSYYALKDCAHLAAGETLLVLGAAGGVGLAAVELGKVMGANVIAAASTDAKLAVCREFGASATINYATEDLRDRLKTLTQGKGVDVIYDPVGGALAEPALRGIGWQGRYLVVGFAAGDIPRIPLNLALLKGCAIVGVFLGGLLQREPQHYQSLIAELLGMLASGSIKPRVAATYPLANAAQALNDLAAHQLAGKLVLVMDDA